MRISRRQFNTLMGSSVLLSSFGARATESEEARMAALHEAARKEGEFTWYIVHLPSDTAERVAQMFSTRFPGVRINVVRTTAQVAYQRLNQDLQAGVANCDVFASTDIGHFLDLKQRKLLMQYAPVSHTKFDSRFSKYDPDGYYTATGSALIGLLYNTDKVRPEEVQASWKVLTDPRWKNQLSVGHPGFSGFVGTWLVAMVDLYGEGFIKDLARNSPQVGRSIIDTVTTVVSGERVLSAGPISLALRQKARGNPIDVIYPEEGSILMVMPTAIMANAPHPNAAKLFLEWTGTPEYASISIEEYSTPLMPGLELKPGVRPIAEVKTIQPDAQSVMTGIPELTETWRDVFGV